MFVKKSSFLFQIPRNLLFHLGHSRPLLAIYQGILCIFAILLCSQCQVADKGNIDPAVTTLNSKYNRLHSHALVRHVNIPTEGYLDFAAYSKNVMLIDPEWHAVHLATKITLGNIDFQGNLSNFKALLDFTPLTENEKKRPLAFAPVLDHLLKWNFEKASVLSNAYSVITGEKWGDTTDLGQAYQEIGSVYIHSNGNVKEVWVELEFKPWLNSFVDGIADQDRDGYPEIFAKLDPHFFTNEMVTEILGDYSTKLLNEGQVMDWARNLASHWYPSYNTDLLELKPESVWPYEESPLNVKSEMAGLWVANPFFILKGHPFEDTLFNVFEVEGMGQPKTQRQTEISGKSFKGSVDKSLNTRLEAITNKINEEEKTYGMGKILNWIKAIEPFQKSVLQFSKNEPQDIQGLISADSILVFRRELEYLLAGDLKDPKASQRPIDIIASFKDYLAAQGIDFLFIPIPTKLDIYPEIIDPNLSLPGNIPQPFFRKLLRDLAEARVETVDLFDPFLKLKAASEKNKRKLYQNQDTHWTTVGIETSAEIISERIRLYSWYDIAFSDKRDYQIHDSLFTSLGDLQPRLAENKKGLIHPEKLLGHQVMERNGKLYENTDSSSVLVIGDSYTGVFETVGCKHAGITAHLAKGLGAPVDLIMGWGGGPEAPTKLKKRGEEYLKNKHLVVWMMSVRDIFVYPGTWALAE